MALGQKEEDPLSKVFIQSGRFEAHCPEARNRTVGFLFVWWGQQAGSKGAVSESEMLVCSIPSREWRFRGPNPRRRVLLVQTGVSTPGLRGLG
jgi:hypothetical protein